VNSVSDAQANGQINKEQMRKHQTRLENALFERDRFVDVLQASNAPFRAVKQKLTLKIEECDSLTEDFKDEKKQFRSELALRTAGLETLQQQLCAIMKNSSRSLTALQATRKGEHET
jgi:hypothetical protein